MGKFTGILGIVVLLSIAYLLSNNRKKINNAFRIDLGVQHLTDGVLNIGTSFTIITLDNF